MSHSRPGWCGVRLGVEGAPVAAVRLLVGQVEVVAGEHGLLAAGHHLAARSGIKRPPSDNGERHLVLHRAALHVVAGGEVAHRPGGHRHQPTGHYCIYVII